MNYTFWRVAAHCGLRLSYYSTASLLAIAFLLLAMSEYRTASPLYILLALAVLPSICKALFFNSKKTAKRENTPAFPLFCEKYHFNSVAYKSMNVAYLLLFFLFAAWHISYVLFPDAPAIIRHLPVLLAASSLLLRIFGTLGYRLYFYLFPLSAMR